LVSHELSELVFLLLIIRLDFPDSAGLWLQSLANELVMGGTVFVKGRSNIVALLAVRVEPRSIGSWKLGEHLVLLFFRLMRLLQLQLLDLLLDVGVREFWLGRGLIAHW